MKMTGTSQRENGESDEYMKKAMIVAAAAIFYAIINISCFLIYFLNPYSGWSFVTSVLLMAYTLFVMYFFHKKGIFTLWTTWLCIVPCGAILTVAGLLLIQPLAQSASFYGATALLFILWGGVVQCLVWMAAAGIAGGVFLYRYRKK